MKPSLEQRARRIMSGEARGAGATLLRGILAITEPVYAGAMRTRNWMFDRGLRRSHTLPRPVVSVGNITTGGTGKTPVVRWLVERCCANGHRPAVLLRGYTVGADVRSDEAELLDRLLNVEAQRVPVMAGADRVASAHAALARDESIDLFILDDGFQHRRVRRDFDLVLIDATNPFGYGRVFPRGMLREPLAGLSRASAFLITHANEVSPAAIEAITAELRRHNSAAAVYRASHEIEGFVSGDAALPVDAIRHKRYYAFCGIGNPQSFRQQLANLGGTESGFRVFADHHAYTANDLATLQRDAAAEGADLLLSTQKDGVKLAALTTGREQLPICQAKLELRFPAGDEAALLGQITEAARPRGAGSVSAPAGP